MHRYLNRKKAITSLPGDISGEWLAEPISFLKNNLRAGQLAQLVKNLDAQECEL